MSNSTSTKVEAGRCAQHCEHDPELVYKGVCCYHETKAGYAGNICGHVCSPSPRVCQQCEPRHNCDPDCEFCANLHKQDIDCVHKGETKAKICQLERKGLMLCCMLTAERYGDSQGRFAREIPKGTTITCNRCKQEIASHGGRSWSAK